jgi:hypothetical protein
MTARSQSSPWWRDEFDTSECCGLVRATRLYEIDMVHATCQKRLGGSIHVIRRTMNIPEHVHVLWGYRFLRVEIENL